LSSARQICEPTKPFAPATTVTVFTSASSQASTPVGARSHARVRMGSVRNNEPELVEPAR